MITIAIKGDFAEKIVLHHLYRQKADAIFLYLVVSFIVLVE